MNVRNYCKSITLYQKLTYIAFEKLVTNQVEVICDGCVDSLKIEDLNLVFTHSCETGEEKEDEHRNSSIEQSMRQTYIQIIISLL